MLQLPAHVVAALLFAIGLPAQAEVIVGVSVQFPRGVVTGQNLSASLVLSFANTAPNDNPLNGNTITELRLTPSCGTVADSATCPDESVDLGIFTLASPAVGDEGCFAGGGEFTVGAPDPGNGLILITPDFAPSFEVKPGAPCTIQLQVTVNAKATEDADGVLSGFQTAVLVDATAIDFQAFEGGGFGSGIVSFSEIATTPGPGGTLVAGGAPAVNLTDTATLTGLVSASVSEPPTGTVRFTLYRPDTPTCLGEALHTELVDVEGPNCTVDSESLLVTCSTSDTYTAEFAGTWRWTVDYTDFGGVNPDLSSSCGAENVIVNKAATTLATTPDPGAGTQLATPLRDTATLTAFEPASGTLTFTLYPPSDPTCAGPAIFTDVVDVGIGPPYESQFAPANLITEFGTYRWEAAYGGDDNNNPATSACAAEPVTVSPLTALSVAKTPDGATISAGDTATFTITVTNVGMADATNVVVNDPLPAGAQLAWATPTAGCSITGSGTTQALACAVAFLSEGASFVATVSAVTSLGNCPTLSSTATAQATEAAPASNGGSIVCGAAVLAVTKTPDGATITAGDSATFTITVANTGVSAATNVILSDPLPAGATLDWHTNTGGCTITGSGAAQTLSCSVESLAAGASFAASVSAVTAVGNCPALSSTATAQADNAPAASNGGSITCQQPVLAVSKTPDGATIAAGDPATFTITVTNTGPGTANSVAISDPLPAGALLTWQTPTAGCTVTGIGAAQALSCAVASLGAGASFVATVSALTSVGSCPAMSTTATASASNAAPASNGGSIVCGAAVLAVTKTPDGATITAGATATFTITVANTGVSAATNVVIGDSLPAGATLDWNTSSAGCAITGSGAAQTLSCSVESLAAGASFAASVSAVTAVGNCPALSSTATAQADNAPAASNGGSITCQQPVLAVSKTPDGATIAAGDPATFTITVTNTGPGTANSVAVSDPLPAGATLDWNTSSTGCAITGSGAAQALACTVPSLAANASFAATVSAVTGVGKCALMNNTATAKGTNTAAAGNSGSIDCQQPVLAVAKAPDAAIVTAGDTATFTITATNAGPGIARGVVISDPLPAGAQLAWQTGTNGCAITGSGAAQALTCTVGSLAANASFAATVSAVTGVGKCATMNNTATATGSNTAAAGDAGSIDCQQPVLAVAKTPDNAIITAGDTATFTIAVTNAGPGTASNVTLSDPLPAGAQLAWQTTTAGCAITGSGAAQALLCTVASLAPDASFTAAVSAATGVGKCPVMSSTATATGSNTAAAGDAGSIACQQPVLTVTKTPDEATVIAGSTATFTIAVTNAGPGTAGNVTLSDPLPAGELLAWQTGTAGCSVAGSGAAQALSCAVPSLAAGASLTATVSAVTAVGKCPVMTNTATASGSNAAAASDAGSITCRTPPILGKSSEPTTIGVGGTATLTYTLTNVAGNPEETVGFVDVFRKALRVAELPGVGGTCPGAKAATTAVPGGTTVTVTDLPVPPGPSSCTVTVVVTSAPGETGTCPATDPSGIVSASNILVNTTVDGCIAVKTFGNALSVTTLAAPALGDGTGGIATDPVLRRAYVTNSAPPSVSVIDLDTLAVVATIPLAGHPEGIVADAASQYLYVASATAPGAIMVIDALAAAVVATIPVGDHPQGIAADFQRGELYVSNRGGNSLSVIDVATNAVVATIAGIGTQPGDPGVDASLGKIFVTSALDGTVAIIDRNARALRAVVGVGTNPGNAAVSEATRKVYVNNIDDRTVSVIDSTTDAVVATIVPVGAGSTLATVSDVYRRAYLPNAADGTLSVIDIDADAVVRTIAVGASPQQAAVDPGKGNVYVVNRLSNYVSVIDALTAEVVATFGVGTEPWRVALAPDRVLVLNENGAAADTITIAFDGGTQLDSAIATELYSSGINHYDHTANALETRLLRDGIVGSAWMPTSAYFRVWTAPGAGRTAMCAFSTAGYGDKDSSYYTPYAEECRDLQNSAAWYYEGTGYYVAVPDAGGGCPASTAELYLLYNNLQGGAPNFRYAGSRAIRDAMLAQGWTARGSGDQRVFACTPPLWGTP